MISIIFVAVLLEVAAGAGQKSTCAQNGPCACTFDDGFAMDLSKMEGLADDNKPMYKDKIPTDSAKNFHYSYKPCYKFDYSGTMSACAGVASCQVDTDNTDSEQNAGKQENAEFWEEDGKIMIKYGDFEIYPTRVTYVNLVCAGSNSLEVQGELTGSTPSRYDYTLYTPQACRPGAGGLSVGTVLCILLVVFIVVYIVGGILFMKFRAGASGVELVPNLNFWKDFPVLIKDGACFSISPCRKSGEYSKL